MILGRDVVEIQMNEYMDQVREGSICYMTVSGIETIYKEIRSKIPVDPSTGDLYSVNRQPFDVKEFALYDPFGNLLFFRNRLINVNSDCNQSSHLEVIEYNIGDYRQTTLDFTQKALKQKKAETGSFIS